MISLTRVQGLITRKRALAPITLAVLLAACNGDSSGPTTTTSFTNGTSSPAIDLFGTGSTNVGAGTGDSTSTGVAAAGATNTADVIASLTNVGTAAKTYYVATNGNDGADGLSIDRPLRTIQYALGLVNPGDTIQVRGGTYYGGLTIRRAGTAGARIKLKAYNNEQVKVAGSGDVALYVQQGAPYWIIQGLDISGGNYYVIKTDAPNVNIVSNNLHGSGADIVKLVLSSNDVVIYGNEIHHNNAGYGANAQGVDIVGADRTWVAHNYVHDIPSIGIYSKGNTRNSLFEHNRLENIAYRGLMLGQSTGGEYTRGLPYESYDGIIRNNIVVNSGSACLATASSYNVKIYNNSCYDAATTMHGAIFVSNEAGNGQAGTNIEIKNNIVVSAGRPVVKVNSDAMTDFGTIKIENNLFWAKGGAVNVDWRGSTNSFDAWKASTGNGAGSFVADPKYTSLIKLTIAADSPAVNAGVPVSVANTSYNPYAKPKAVEDYNHETRPKGSAIDIGAYEVN